MSSSDESSTSILTIHFIRHAQSLANRDKNVAGQTLSPLTDKGIKQAKLLADHLPEYDLIYSSTLPRAINTLKYALGLNHGTNGIEVHLRDDLRERYWGKFEGASYEEVLQKQKEIDLSLYLTYLENNDVEGDDELRHRVKKVVDEIVQKMIEMKIKSTLVFTHGGLIKQFFEWNRWPIEKSFYNTEIITVAYDKGNWKMIKRFVPPSIN